ncbi:hypothetical protein SporoP37_15850 [Sporosarcina sp. P37]|uniref:phage tail protein n=1 Tax=unclassified Sporosarcina TaxID=2647733 RepID=UPI000A17B9D6|nr:MULTISPECIES: phage tail protein [unclassified Sporosarcina]ARK26000.1 hypothetical protein SporoP37_15850 [Sporosarcina sp. P37]PID19368.1 hypothetical protein CSV62_02370 [Sporosarcina sp. P35]
MITLDLHKVEEIERLLSQTPDQVNRVLAIAINSSASHGRRRAASAVRKEYVVDRLGAMQDLKMIRATPGYLRAELKSVGTPIALFKFDTIPKFPDAAKVRARVKRASAHKNIESAFVAQMRSGHINVFERVGKSRTPIKGLYSPSLPQMYGNDDVIKDVEPEVEKRLDQELTKLLERMLWG